MHLFIAFEVPESVRSVLLQRQQVLQACMPTGLHYVPQENMHVTLLFLGKIPDDCIPELISRLESFFKIYLQQNREKLPLQLASKLSAVELNSDTEPRVVWCRLLASDFLDSLRHDLCVMLNKISACTGKNYCARRPFLPHITLGRVKKTGSLSQLNTCLVSDQPLNQELVLSTITLKRSTLTTHSAVYTTLWSKKLV